MLATAAGGAGACSGARRPTRAFARLGGAPYDEASAQRANQATLAFLADRFAAL